MFRYIANFAVVAVMALSLTVCKQGSGTTPSPIPNPPPDNPPQEPPAPLIDSVELVAPPGAPGSVCGTTQRIRTSPRDGGARVLVRYTTTRPGAGEISVWVAVDGIFMGQGNVILMETAQGVFNALVTADDPGITSQVYVYFKERSAPDPYFEAFIPCEITWE